MEDKTESLRDEKTLIANPLKNLGNRHDADDSGSEDGAFFHVGSHEFVPELDLEEETGASEYTSQMEALYYLLKGDNVVLCGQAGAGKSWVIDTFKDIVKHFEPRLERDGREFTIATTASTGVAASLIMGQTIHSWSGLGISVDKFDPRKLQGRAKGTWLNAKQRIKNTDCLIIDEVSMLPSYFLTNLDRACKIARRKPDKPFGGIQIVLVGDFLQLPPVGKNEMDSDGNPVDSSYCFNAKDNEGKPIFGVSGFKWCYLDRVRRSKDDRLTMLLNDIRNENVTQEDIENLRSRFNVDPEPGKTYTQLRTINRSVDEYNERKLDGLHGRSVRYRVSWDGDDKKARELIKNSKLTDIDLKPGAVVMLTSNRAVQDNQHVNGSMGTVIECDDSCVRIRFNDGQTRDVYRQCDRITKVVMNEHLDEDTGAVSYEEEEVELAHVLHLPVRLAWAITVHKSQGQTLDGAIIDLSRCFQRGLGYVALSRCKSLDDIIMDGSFEDLPLDALRIDETAVKADRKIRSKAKRDRETLMENEVRVSSLTAALNTASSKASANRIRKQMEDTPSVGMILADDESCYKWVRDHRSRRLPSSRRKRNDMEWDNSKSSPSGFGFGRKW